MHIMSVRILEIGLIARAKIVEVFVVTELWRAGRKEIGVAFQAG